MFNLLISDNILDEEERAYSPKDKHYRKVTIVIDKIGNEPIDQGEIFRRLTEIGALPNNGFGRWRLSKLIAWGIPNEDGSEAEEYRFIHKGYSADTGEKIYQLLAQWI